MTAIKNYNPAFDIMKCIAAIMITNSHFTPLYKDFNTSFATLGVHGNALFFFVSGFLLFSSLQRKNYNISFSIWYQKKVKRLWIPIIVLALLTGFLKPDITWYNFMPTPWFVKCFLVSFPIIFFIIRSKKDYVLWTCLVLSLSLSIGIILFTPPQSLSIFHKFHYFCYFPIMLLGVTVSKYNSVILRKNKPFHTIVSTLVSFIAYFLIMKIGKGCSNSMYYTQLFAYIPLLLFLVFTYKMSNLAKIKKLAHTKYFFPVKIIATLTFEIYIIQHLIITDKFNAVFPLNIIIVFALITIAAYILKVATVLFEQTILDKGWDIKSALKLF